MMGAESLIPNDSRSRMPRSGVLAHMNTASVLALMRLSGPRKPPASPAPSPTPPVPARPVVSGEKHMRVIKHQEQGSTFSARYVVDVGGAFLQSDNLTKVGLFQICRFRWNGAPVTDKVALLSQDWFAHDDQEHTKRSTINANGWFVDVLDRPDAAPSPYYEESFSQSTLDGTTRLINEELAQLNFIDRWFQMGGEPAEYGNWSNAHNNCVPIGLGGSSYIYLTDKPMQPQPVSLEFKVHLLGTRSDGNYLLGPGFYWAWNSAAQDAIPAGGNSAITAVDQVPDNDVISCLQMWVAVSKNAKKIPIAG